MRVTVLVRPKDGILDPQGEAIGRALQGLGFAASAVRAGKVFDVELDVDDAASAEQTARALAEQVLANPLMEQYEVSVDG